MKDGNHCLLTVTHGIVGNIAVILKFIAIFTVDNGPCYVVNNWTVTI